jgi:arginase
MTGEPLLIEVPYHLGRERVGPGAGVEPLVEAIGADSVVVDRGRPFQHELGAAFDVLRALAQTVRETVAAGRFPLVVAGNCSSAVGTVAGLGRDDLGVVWLDAHADFNTPDTTESGFLEGFGLALLTGSGFDAMRASIEGHLPIPEERVVLLARDIDPGEKRRLDASQVRLVDLASFDEALDELSQKVGAVYVHVDLDVLDPSEGRANFLAAENVLSLAELERAVAAVLERFEVAAAAITWYEPRVDPDGLIPPKAASVAARLTRARTHA